MSGNQLPDIKHTLEIAEGSITIHRWKNHTSTTREIDTTLYEAVGKNALDSFLWDCLEQAFRARVWRAAEQRHPRIVVTLGAVIDNLRVAESDPVPPEPLGHDVETVEDDPADNTSSPYCPVCGQRRALCERDPKCSGAKALARMFPASLSGQTRKGWLDFITRGCAALRREYALAPLWLIVTRQVPAVVDVLELDDDLVVML